MRVGSFDCKPIPFATNINCVKSKQTAQSFRRMAAGCRIGGWGRKFAEHRLADDWSALQTCRSAPMNEMATGRTRARTKTITNPLACWRWERWCGACLGMEHHLPPPSWKISLW
jgi:hypothetical protein